MKNIFKDRSGQLVNVAVSAVMHLLLFFIISFILNASQEGNMVRNLFVEVTTGAFTKEESAEPQEEETAEYTEPEKAAPEAEPEEEAETGAVFYSLSEKNTDTTGLKNIYTERTLGVKIKYPSGWNFIDQNVKNKLDGVTFWGLANIYNPPPYIHLEVKEKYLFNPSRFKYSQQFKDYTIFYNDPEEMADQYTQIIYIRTEDDEDYSLKLIMKGKEAFITFQPVFFGMLKTFTFNN